MHSTFATYVLTVAVLSRICTGVLTGFLLIAYSRNGSSSVTSHEIFRFLAESVVLFALINKFIIT